MLQSAKAQTVLPEEVSSSVLPAQALLSKALLP
jgi:hypothetical protein